MAHGPSSSSGKKTRGRQKIEMKKIEKENDRLVTFSKRRSGIYKQASELATLCGAEIAILVFSPSGKAYTFGHPSFESVANRYLNENPPVNDNTHPLVEAQRSKRINEMIKELNNVEAQLEAGRERGQLLDQLNAETKNKRSWEIPEDKMNLEQLKQRRIALEDLLMRVLNKKSQFLNADFAAARRMMPSPTMMAPNVMNNPFGGYMWNNGGPGMTDPTQMMGNTYGANMENIGLGNFCRDNSGSGGSIPPHGPF